MKTACLRIAAGALVLSSSVHCSAPTAPVERVSDDGTSYVPAEQWRTASPAAIGLDPSRIRKLESNVASGRYGAVQGLVVVRFGYVALEQYVGWSRDQLHTMQSVSKSVTSLMFGIASNGGTSSDLQLDRPLVDILARYTPIANLDDRKRALTLRHLLSMRTNMDFWEHPYAGSPLEELNRSRGDWTRFVLDRPMLETPGTSWGYNSGAAIITCSVLRETTGESPVVFARRELFHPIGVTTATWYVSAFDSLPHCGGGLLLKPVDLARVGYLVLRHGRWGDRQVVPAAWIDASTGPVTTGPTVFFSGYGSGYGYFWWTFPTSRGGHDAGIIAASGSGDQWLFIIPSLDLVVAVVANTADVLGLLYDELLPAVMP